MFNPYRQHHVCWVFSMSCVRELCRKTRNDARTCGCLDANWTHEISFCSLVRLWRGTAGFSKVDAPWTGLLPSDSS
jgi:hypothetical protein